MYITYVYKCSDSEGFLDFSFDKLTLENEFEARLIIRSVKGLR